jgi:hypothetical protein
MRFNRSASPLGSKTITTSCSPADLAAADVLRDEQLGQPRLAHARGAQHQGVADALAQRQGDVDLVRFDAMQARQSADRRQRPRRVERTVPGQRRAPASRVGNGANSSRSSSRRAAR